MKLSEAIQEYLITKAPGLTNKSLRWYTHKLKLFNKWCSSLNPPTIEVEEVNNVLVSRFIETLKDRSSYTKHGYVQTVKGFLNWCIENEEGKVSEKAVKRIKLPRIQQSQITIFTPEEIKTLRLAASRTPFPKRNLALIDLLLDTGARISEIIYDPTRPEERTGLLIEDVHIMGEDTADPYISVMGKGRKPRSIPLGQISKASLRLYIRNYRNGSNNPYVFLSRRGEPLTLSGVESIIQKLVEETKLEIHPHKFRHTFACMYLMNGGTINDLRILLGHTDIKTTMLYLRAIEGMGVRDRAHSVLDKVGKR